MTKKHSVTNLKLFSLGRKRSCRCENRFSATVRVIVTLGMEENTKLTLNSFICCKRHYKKRVGKLSNCSGMMIKLSLLLLQSPSVYLSVHLSHTHPLSLLFSSFPCLLLPPSLLLLPSFPSFFVPPFPSHPPTSSPLPLPLSSSPPLSSLFLSSPLSPSLLLSPPPSSYFLTPPPLPLPLSSSFPLSPPPSPSLLLLPPPSLFLSPLLSPSLPSPPSLFLSPPSLPPPHTSSSLPPPSSLPSSLPSFIPLSHQLSPEPDKSHYGGQDDRKESWDTLY